MLIDTHMHLDLITEQADEIGQIIDQCKKQKINILFNISVDHKSNLFSRDLSEKYPKIYFSAGIHPSEADNYIEEQIDDIDRIASHEKCIGIGETGIDLYRDYSRADIQKELFGIFLNMAKKHDKPVIIHSREAFQEVYGFISKNEFKDVKGVFHCFSYTFEEAKKSIDQGYMISFAGNLTYKNAHSLHETAKKIPLEHILLETDSPYLAPMPLRGKKNYPYHIVHTAEFLSQIKGIPLKDLEEKLYHNVKSFFKIDI